MKSAPLFSIIIPVKARFNFAKEAIKSIYKQKKIDFRLIEVMIVEERNYGETIRFRLKKLFPDVQVILNNDNRCSGGSRNTGLKAAKGKYVIFLDSDDQMESFFLYHLMYHLRNNPDCCAIICLSKSKFQHPFSLMKKIQLLALIFIRDVSLILFYICNQKKLEPSAFYLCQISHMMFRRNCLKGLRFKKDYRYGAEDWDFFIQVLKRGSITILLERLTLFRYSSGSSTTTPVNLKKKWDSYILLSKRLPEEMKKRVYFHFFLHYIHFFRG